MTPEADILLAMSVLSPYPSHRVQARRLLEPRFQPLFDPETAASLPAWYVEGLLTETIVPARIF